MKLCIINDCMELQFLPHARCKPHHKIHQNEYQRSRNSQFYTYQIENILTGKKYYGSTSQRDRWYYHKRFATHKYDKHFPKTYDRELYVEMRKIGLDNFTFTRLKDHKTRDKARLAEYNLIKRDSKCYNVMINIAPKRTAK